MPATKRSKPLYERGGYQLHRREGRTALEIVWYDDERKRERSASARTENVELGRAALDRLYLEKTKGEAFCPTCGQRREATRIYLAAAIADYLTLSAGKPSIEAIRPRLTHVLSYLVEKDLVGTACDDVDEDWIERFRKWLHAKPIVTPTGIKKERSWSTVENSVLQLAAAVNRSGGMRAKFKARQPKEVNQTPQHRSDIEELAAMFRYCVSPPPGKQPAERARRDRASLLAFMRISVATMARPDAAHDVSTDPMRSQWNSARKILDLNPAQRRQTRKYRATVPVPRQMARVLDSTEGYLIPGTSVKSAWETMAKALGLPGEGESGMKLIRRSIANLVRQRLPQEAWGELEMFLGHDKFDDVSDLYAPFRPDYLRRALTTVEAIIDEIELIVPGAFSL
ncbi:hypothetical protein [Sphingomonas sp. UYP23]